ncbi:MAG: ankyrin repeat domain-containing protein [Vicinamibacterales bacterium]
MRSRVAVLLVAAACASCGVFRPTADDLRDDPHGHLVWAARTGDIGAIRALAAAGIDLDASAPTPSRFVFPDFDHGSWTALQHAVGKQQVDAVRVLLEVGAAPDARPEGSPITPLTIAAVGGNATIVRLLLDAGADVNLSRQALSEPAPGGPLWHVVERTVGWVSGRPSAKDALARLPR